MEIAAYLNITEFSGSTSLLDRFRSRHGIMYWQISGKAESVNYVDIALLKDNSEQTDSLQSEGENFQLLQHFPDYVKLKDKLVKLFNV